MKYQITVIDDSPDSILAGNTRLPVTIRRRNVAAFEVVQADNNVMLEALKAWEHWYSVDSTEFNRDMAQSMGLAAIAHSERHRQGPVDEHR